METIISSIITGVAVMALIGLVWKNLTERVNENKVLKVNKETCKIIHVQVDKNYEALIKKLESMDEKLGDMAGDVKLIKKGINGGT